MSMDSVETAQSKPADLNIHKLEASAISKAIAVKALKTNKTDVLVSGSEAALKANKGFPLAPGEQIALDLAGTQLFFQCGNVEDGIAWISISP